MYKCFKNHTLVLLYICTSCYCHCCCLTIAGQGRIGAVSDLSIFLSATLGGLPVSGLSNGLGHIVWSTGQPRQSAPCLNSNPNPECSFCNATLVEMNIIISIDCTVCIIYISLQSCSQNWKFVAKGFVEFYKSCLFLVVHESLWLYYTDPVCGQSETAKETFPQIQLHPLSLLLCLCILGDLLSEIGGHLGMAVACSNSDTPGKTIQVLERGNLWVSLVSFNTE